MRFLLDENVDARLASVLRARGHDVVSVVDDPGAGSSDVNVLAAALGDRRIVLTNDADFGDLVLRRRLPHSGIVLFRLRTTDYAAKLAALELVLEHYSARLNEFLVVTEGRVRVRRSRR